MQINPTQLIGMLAFAVAALACARAARRRREAWVGPWSGMLLAQLAFIAEIVFGLRHRLHDSVDALLQGSGLYASRTGLQEALIGLALLVVGLGLAMGARWWRRDAGVALAMSGTGLAFALFVTEAISLHRIDALMYAQLGPVKLIALAWSAAAAVVAGSAWRAVKP